VSVSLESLMRGADPALERPSAVASLAGFVIVGATATLSFIGLSTLMIGLRTGVPDWLMSAFCYAVLIVPAYLVHRRVSFRSSAPHGHALPRYVMVQICSLLLSALFSYVVYGSLHIATPLAAAIVVCLTAGVNFVVLRLWAFATH
jgi:putative flippase GtrA